jgi:hypothetical protein
MRLFVVICGNIRYLRSSDVIQAGSAAKPPASPLDAGLKVGNVPIII